MIVSASYRTDIPAFYGAWFLNRLKAGFCRVANPYGGKPYEVPLRGDQVDGFVFWTRNAAPFRPALERLAADNVPFVVQYSLTAYPRPLETSVVACERTISEMRDLAARFGEVAVDEVIDVAVAELVDGEVGDADQDGVSILLGPLVGGCVAAVFGAHGCAHLRVRE